MAVSQNTLGRRAEQDTPTSNEGLLTSETGDTSAMDRGDAKKTSPSQSGKAKKGPRYTKSGNVVCSIVMLDGHNVDFELPKSAKGQDLVDKACESLQLLEKDYFSCSYMVNDARFWVNHEKKISKQLKGNSWDFKFEVKFYPPEPQHMAEDITRYQLFLQVRTDVYTGKLPCSFMTHCLLGSLAAQSEFGDYDAEELGMGIQYLKESAPYAPNQSDEMLEKICELHKTHRGLTPADAELTYLDNAKLMALYGVDLHRAKDKDDYDVMVGVSSAGLSIYKEKLRIHRFPWAKILKFAYKRNFFYIKNRPGENEKQATNLTYKLANYTMAKRLWKVAVEQHSFFRLKEAESPKRAVFPLFGSKFRYSGRTQFQTRNDASHIERKTPTIDRAASRKYAGNWKNYDTSGNTLERRNFFDGPSYSTDRVEEVIVPGDSHTTTLDIKSIRKNKAPLPSSEDDRNMSVSDQQYDGSVSFQGPNYSSASYSRQLGPGGYSGQESRFDQFGNPIPSSRGGLEGPYGTDGSSTNGRKTGPPVLEKPKNAKGNMNGDHEDEDLPPYQEDHFMMKGGGAAGRDKFGGQYTSSTTSKTTTRTYRGADGVMVTEHKMEKDGVIETRIEKKTLITSSEDDYDHDKALHDAIFAVTDMNPDLSVEKIEIQTERSDRK